MNPHNAQYAPRRIARFLRRRSASSSWIFAAILLPPLLLNQNDFRYPPPASAGSTAAPQATAQGSTEPDWMQPLDSGRTRFSSSLFRSSNTLIAAVPSG